MSLKIYPLCWERKKLYVKYFISEFMQIVFFIRPRSFIVIFLLVKNK